MMTHIIKNRKIFLAAGIFFFLTSLLIRIDAVLIGAVLGIGEIYQPLIQKIAAISGALGGMLIGLYYAAGFFHQHRMNKGKLSDEA